MNGGLSKQAFERKLAAVEALREREPDVAEPGLRKALDDRNNYIVSKAAKIAGELGLRSLVPGLLAAFDRFFDDPVKTDPQCWAKNALSKALVDLGHDDPDPFLRGLQHVQMEPVYGRSEDTAGTLRGQCALALVACRSLSDMTVLTHLTDALVDPDKTVRVEAARAIGRVNREEGVLVLRLKALIGDKEPEPIGACFSSLLEFDRQAGIRFVQRFLDRGDEAAEEAAMVLGMTREPEALAVLKERWARESDSMFADVLLSAIGLTRLPEAIEFLAGIVETGLSSAEAAIEALAWARGSTEIRARLEAAVERAGSARLRQVFDEAFG